MPLRLATLTVFLLFLSPSLASAQDRTVNDVLKGAHGLAIARPIVTHDTCEGMQVRTAVYKDGSIQEQVTRVYPNGFRAARPEESWYLNSETDFQGLCSPSTLLTLIDNTYVVDPPGNQRLLTLAPDRDDWPEILAKADADENFVVTSYELSLYQASLNPTPVPTETPQELTLASTPPQKTRKSKPRSGRVRRSPSPAVLESTSLNSPDSQSRSSPSE
jgi:hypothetical protein